MRPATGRGLLRTLADSLQCGLFDDDGDAREPALRAADSPGPPMRHPQATRELVVDGQRLAFRVARVRRKSIGFVVDANGLTVRAPSWVTLRDIDAGVVEKKGWIMARFA